MLRREYEAKVAYEGDDLIVTHVPSDGEPIVRTYWSETFTATEAVRELIREQYDIEVTFEFSGDIPGGHLYVVAEADIED